MVTLSQKQICLRLADFYEWYLREREKPKVSIYLHDYGLCRLYSSYMACTTHLWEGETMEDRAAHTLAQNNMFTWLYGDWVFPFRLLEASHVERFGPLYLNTRRVAHVEKYVTILRELANGEQA